MEQALFSGYSCGESLMNYMKKKLCKRDAKILCHNSIITQRNFHNSIHLDKKSVFSREANQYIKTHICKDQNRNKRLLANRYITTMLVHARNKIPKSTTCCWRLSNNYEELTIYQYFVSPQYMFGLNLSSKVFFDSNDVGATFMLSLFYHCTSIPIWKNKNVIRYF